MISQELLTKIRLLEIKTRRLLHGNLVGQTRSATKGYGLEFDQLREYQLGDDIRFIDWKSSARMNKILVKEYKEEKNRTIILVLDTSGSSYFGSEQHAKYEIMTQIASVLAFIAMYAKDRVGLILFSDKVHRYIPPKKGLKHIHLLMQHMLEVQPQGATDLKAVFKYLAQLRRKDAVVFILSDFIDEGFEKLLGVISHMYDLVMIRCLDIREQLLPAVGFLDVEDIETNELATLDVNTYRYREIEKFLSARIMQQNMLFKKYGIDCLEISAKQQWLEKVIHFLCNRMSY